MAQGQNSFQSVCTEQSFVILELIILIIIFNHTFGFAQAPGTGDMLQVWVELWQDLVGEKGKRNYNKLIAPTLHGD